MSIVKQCWSCKHPHEFPSNRHRTCPTCIQKNTEANRQRIRKLNRENGYQQYLPSYRRNITRRKPRKTDIRLEMEMAAGDIRRFMHQNDIEPSGPVVYFRPGDPDFDDLAAMYAR